MTHNWQEDAKNGTQGPWAASHRGGSDGACRTQVYEVRDPDNTICTVHWHSIKTDTGFRTDRDELARRIARVPQLEKVAMAAKGFVENENPFSIDRLVEALEALNNG